MALSSSLIAFVLSHLLIFHFARGQKQTHSNCTESFECGSLGIMSFPFSKFTEPNCGLCMVDCDAQPSPQIKLWPGRDWYDTVGQRHANKIRIKFPWLKEGGNCIRFNIPPPLPNPASISFTVFPNITLFKCNTSSIDQSLDHHFAGYEKFADCDKEHGFRVYYNYTNETDSTTLPTPPHGCSIIQLPRVDFDPNLDPKNLDPKDLNNLLAGEFDLEWHVSDDCHDCHLRGRQCLTDSNHTFQCSEVVGIFTSQGSHRLRLILGIVAAASGVAILMLVFFCCLRKKSSIYFFKMDKYQDVETFLGNYGALAPQRYHYCDIKKMTSSFKNRLGEGGYGSVYKGKLRDDSFVAVKILNDTKGNGEEFINEVASISRTSHVNIVKLFGFCFEGNKRALIYEFMPNGSLDKFIFKKNSLVDHQLGWKTLYKIAVGIARGLEYLHCRCNTQILHFDIKPHNILLDEDFSPKISDFGLSKLSTRTKSIVSMLGARGTIGYIAPEIICRTFGGVSHKSDVYSYGMMILEMVGGRKNINVEVDHTSEIYYPHWIYKQLELNQELGFDGILDEEENGKARKMIIVSLWCIQTDPSTRPSMTKVVEMLEGNLDSLQIPPKPYLYSPSRSPVEALSVQIT